MVHGFVGLSHGATTGGERRGGSHEGLERPADTGCLRTFPCKRQRFSIITRYVTLLRCGRDRASGANLQEPNLSAWVIIHWFEIGTLVLLCLNLWFVSSVLKALRETNRWLVFLSRVEWDRTNVPERPNEH